MKEDQAALSTGRKTGIALAAFAVLAGFAWKTMEAGTMRTVVLVVLGGFALRLLLGLRRPRYDDEQGKT